MYSHICTALAACDPCGCDGLLLQILQLLEWFRPASEIEPAIDYPSTTYPDYQPSPMPGSAATTASPAPVNAAAPATTTRLGGGSSGGRPQQRSVGGQPSSRYRSGATASTAAMAASAAVHTAAATARAKTPQESNPRPRSVPEGIPTFRHSR